MDALIQLTPAAPRLPEWLRRSRTHFDEVHQLKSELRRLNLHTVCESARCPNMHECFHRGTATFMILGNLCTRGCGFCSVLTGGLSIISEDAAVRRETLSHMKDCIAAAAEVGSALIAGPLYSPVGYLPGRRRTADEWNWAVECYQQLGPVLESHGVEIALKIGS